MQYLGDSSFRLPITLCIYQIFNGFIRNDISVFRQEGRKKWRFTCGGIDFQTNIGESPLLPSLPPKENLVIPNSSTDRKSSAMFKNHLKVDE